MKFAQQLQQGAVEEWRRAYVDYRLLKKLIKAAAKSEESIENAQGNERHDSTDAIVSPPDSQIVLDDLSSDDEHPTTMPSTREVTPGRPLGPPIRHVTSRADSAVSAGSDLVSQLRNRKASKGIGSSFRNSRWRYPPDIPLDILLPRMNSQERKVFMMLDHELEKVEHFYEEREAEALARYKVLREQLEQLAAHREEYLARHAQTNKLSRPLINQGFGHQHGVSTPRGDTPSANDSDRPYTPTKDHAARPSSGMGKFSVKLPGSFHYHPDNYVAARRKLKLAVFEFYKYLGYLKNYRLLNSTAFSKSTKKMEKMSRIKCQKQYMDKVHDARFSNSSVVDDLQSQTETMFGTSFEKGSRKKAVQTLRFMGASATTHHVSIWKAGLALGLAIPALVEGVVKACQQDTWDRIPALPSLLQIWGAFFLPTLLAFGVAINQIGWKMAHINIPLVFYFDSRTHIDYRQFIQIPAFLLFTFGWCFWLSMTVVSDTISPQAWPLVWLFSTIVLLFNPLPIFYVHARWWLIRSTLRVFTAGLVRVQFRDFWLGDQFCSLYYTAYNLGFIVCMYKEHFTAESNGTCSTNITWASPILASLPFLWRLGQSIRRYSDSREVYTHLINAGKYSAGVLYIFIYFNWRIRGGSSYNTDFAMFVVFATINSSYSLAWDLLMDWGLFRRGAKHKFLRNEIAYKNQQWFYYFAIVTNAILRFSWIVYIPRAEYPSLRLKGFLVSLFEALRRWQWNFIRIESEHIGNIDGFRVTRDVPLPYTIPEPVQQMAASMEDHVDADEDELEAHERYRKEHGGDVELGGKRSAFGRILPGELGKKLRTAVFGHKPAHAKGADPDESDDEEISPAEAEEFHRAIKASAKPIAAAVPISPGGSTSVEADRVSLANDKGNLRNYNTFARTPSAGWEGDIEGLRSPAAAHTHM